MTWAVLVLVPLEPVADRVKVVVAVTLTDLLPVSTGVTAPTLWSMERLVAPVTLQASVTLPPPAGRFRGRHRKGVDGGTATAAPAGTRGERCRCEQRQDQSSRLHHSNASSKCLKTLSGVSRATNNPQTYRRTASPRRCLRRALAELALFSFSVESHLRSRRESLRSQFAERPPSGAGGEGPVCCLAEVAVGKVEQLEQPQRHCRRVDGGPRTDADDEPPVPC